MKNRRYVALRRWMVKGMFVKWPNETQKPRQASRARREMNRYSTTEFLMNVFERNDKVPSVIRPLCLVMILSFSSP
jgi:hypothetical protein